MRDKTKKKRIRTKPILYYIIDWDKKYENNRSRQLDHLSWCPVPNNLNDLKYRQLVKGKGGIALFGVWTALILIASTHVTPRLGILSVTGRATDRPLSGNDIHLISGISTVRVEKSMRVFEKMGLISRMQVRDNRTPLTSGCEEVPTEQNRTEQNSTEQSKRRGLQQSGKETKEESIENLKLNESIPAKLFPEIFHKVIRGNWPFTAKNSEREFYRAVKDFPAGAVRKAIDNLASADADNLDRKRITPARLASACRELMPKEKD